MDIYFFYLGLHFISILFLFQPSFNRGEVPGADLVIRYQTDTWIAEETLEEAPEEERVALRSLPTDVQSVLSFDFSVLFLPLFMISC